jgi:hypothetical protein
MVDNVQRNQENKIFELVWTVSAGFLNDLERTDVDDTKVMRDRWMLLS